MSLPIPHATPLSPDSLTRAVTAGKLELARFPWWIVILGGLAVITILFYILYYRLPYLTADMRKDQDPELLTTILRKYSGGIESLGNPRKIKRLSNKIRFQYYYLTAKGWTKQTELDFLANTLLALEVQKAIDANGDTIVQTVLSSETNFKDFLNRKPNLVLPSDTRLVHLIYLLNRDAFY